MPKTYDADERGRNFAFVQKVENLPENWETLVAEKCIPMAYIVHDRDVYTQRDFDEKGEALAGKKVGDMKDSHVHFFAYFSGKKTCGGVIKLFEDLGIKHVEVVVSKNAKLAYFLHIGCDDKYLYDYDDLKRINGIKVDYAALNNVDFGDVLRFIREYNISQFYELIHCSEKKDPPIFKYVCGHYALCCAYFSDRREAAS